MDKFHFSKKGDRKLSTFLGKECLYDYVQGHLDSEREEALEKILTDDRELNKELAHIKDALEYVAGLRLIFVSPPLLESIRTPSTYLHVLLEKMRFSDWPESVKLSVEGLIISLGALAMIIIIPWGRLASIPQNFEKLPVTLAQVTEPPSQDPDIDGKNPQAPEKNGPVYDDEETAPKAVQKTKAAAATLQKPTPAPVVKKLEAKAVAKDPDEEEDSPESPEAPVAKTAAVATAAATAETSSPVAAATTPANSPPAAAGKAPAEVKSAGLAEPPPDVGERQGFLFRGSVRVTNVSAVVPKLAEFIGSVGGRKAGEVELGWRKGSGAYFHFTIPEAKYDELIEEFKKYGDLKIQKEPHPRVMPDGIIRLIINVGEEP